MEREQIDAVLRLAAAQVSDDRQPLTEVVADGWLRQLDADDHAERTAADVCGALLSHWQFADLPEDPWLGTALARYFPAKLRDEFGAHIPRHPLRREIVATHVLNSMVNRVGSTFVHRLAERTGARPAQVVRAYLAAREVLGDVAVWQQVEALDNKVPDAVQSEMLIEEGWLTARATTWFLRSRRLAEPLEQTFRRFVPAVQALRARLEPEAAASPQATAWIAAGVPPPLALRVASADHLIAALDVAEVAEAVQRNFDEVSEVHVGIGNRLGLSRLRQQIDELPSDSHWQALAKAALGDDLAGLQRALAQDVLQQGPGSPAELLTTWGTRNATALERAQRLLTELADAKGGADLSMLSVALRELRNLG